MNLRQYANAILATACVASAAGAQTPTIDSLVLDEWAHRLVVHGTSLPMPAGALYVTDMRLPVISATSEEQTFAIPDTGRGSCGNVTIVLRNAVYDQWYVSRYAVYITRSLTANEGFFAKNCPHASKLPRRRWIQYPMWFRLVTRTGVRIAGRSYCTRRSDAPTKWDFTDRLNLPTGYCNDFNGMGSIDRNSLDSMLFVDVGYDSIRFSYPPLRHLTCSFSYYRSGHGTTIIAADSCESSVPALALAVPRLGMAVDVNEGATSSTILPDGDIFTPDSTIDSVGWTWIGSITPVVRPYLGVDIGHSETALTARPAANPCASAQAAIITEVARPGYVQLTIDDVMGREVEQIERFVTEGRARVEISRMLPAGVYTYRVRQNEDEVTGKLVVR